MHIKHFVVQHRIATFRSSCTALAVLPADLKERIVFIQTAGKGRWELIYSKDPRDSLKIMRDSSNRPGD